MSLLTPKNEDGWWLIFDIIAERISGKRLGLVSFMIGFTTLPSGYLT